MGLGAGHVMDMINRLKDNRSQRPSTRAKFKEGNRDTSSRSPIKSLPPVYKIPDKETLNAIKQEIKLQAKIRKTKNRRFLMLFTLCIVFTIALILWLSV